MGDLEGYVVKDSKANPRGIPEVVFPENVEEFIGKRKPTEVVGKFQELLGKYQYMQSNLLAQKSSLKQKLPDIKQALEMVRHMKKRNEDPASEAMNVTYQLSENIYAKAQIPEKTDKLCLWLGANVMMEYSLEEADELLGTNEKNAELTLAQLEHDVVFLRDQITTTEVNIARTHNYNVKLRQQAKAKGINPDDQEV